MYMSYLIFSTLRSDLETLFHWMEQSWGNTEVDNTVVLFQTPFSDRTAAWQLLQLCVHYTCLISSLGHYFFTIGQRAKLGGKANAWFVARKDPQNNTITVVWAPFPYLGCEQTWCGRVVVM